MSLVQLWEERRVLYEQCMDLQLFHRDTEQVDQWISKQNLFLENTDLGDSLDSVEFLMKKHEDFEKSLNAHEEKVNNLNEFAKKLIENQHYASEEIDMIRNILLNNYNKLLEQSANRRKMLSDSYKLQQFTIDYDDTKFWIVEKLKLSLDDNFSDLTNLSGKAQQSLSFEKEIQANKSKPEEIKASGESLIANDHYASDDIKNKIDDIANLWTQLEAGISDKKSKLNEAIEEQIYNRNIEDVELWLNEIEQYIAIDDYGKDMNSVQNQLKKQSLMEEDVASHQDKINAILAQCNKLNENGHFHSDNINNKKNNLVKRFNLVKIPLKNRRKRLNESLKMHELFCDIDDEIAWINEKEPVAASTNRGHDLMGVQNLIKKHQAIVQEIGNHKNRIQSVIDKADNLLKNEQHYGNEQTREKIQILNDKWNSLIDKANQRKIDLDNSYQVHQYFFDADEAETWMKEKEPLVKNSDYGKDEDSTEALLKKHEVLIDDLEAFGKVIQTLNDTSLKCEQYVSTIDTSSTSV